MNTSALATPASRRCTSRGVAAVKKPLSTMNTVASAEPQSSKAVGGARFNNQGVASAPIR